MLWIFIVSIDRSIIVEVAAPDHTDHLSCRLVILSNARVQHLLDQKGGNSAC